MAPSPPYSWCLPALGIAPGYHTATGAGVTVAVLDTGAELDHPDLKGRFKEGDNAVSFVPGESVRDEIGHGTHCLGIVGGRADAVGGRYSVAPGVNLLAGKVLSRTGDNDDRHVIAGIAWAAEQGARIVVLSMGTPRAMGDPFDPRYEEMAVSLRDSGRDLIFIAAAGNRSFRPWRRAPVCNPAACPSYMAVAAVDAHARVGYESCAGLGAEGRIAVSAPGIDVRSAWRGHGHASQSGTSMAASHVAGVAALHLERDPGLSATALWSRLVSTARPLGDPSDYGAGLVQAP